MDSEATKAWFQDIDRVIAEPLKFKAQLAIGEDAYSSLKAMNFVGRSWDTLGVANAAASVAKSSAVASTFFAPTGWLGAIGFGTATTPVGWIIAAAIFGGSAWYWITRKMGKGLKKRVIVIPEFINTPLDMLAVSLFDRMAPLALKIAEVDGEIHKAKRSLIESNFIDQWGYDQDFVRAGMAYSESVIPKLYIEILALNLANFKKINRDCNYKVMTQQFLAFLQDIIESDNRILESEGNALKSVEKVIKDVDRLLFITSLLVVKEIIARKFSFGKKSVI